MTENPSSVGHAAPLVASTFQSASFSLIESLSSFVGKTGCSFFKGKTDVIERRIEKKTSRTAAMTCMSRAVSYLASNSHYHSNDHIAVKILPGFIRALIHISLFRKLFVRVFAPPGVYEYVIARTKYIDAAFENALADRWDQILIFGAGLEGLLMYLEPASVQETFQIIRAYGSAGNRVVFDYVRASVLRRENTLYGEAGLVKSVHKAGEPWRFGIEPCEIGSFAAAQGFKVNDHKCAGDLEADYFQDKDGRIIGRINGAHCIVTMEMQ